MFVAACLRQSRPI